MKHAKISDITDKSRTKQPKKNKRVLNKSNNTIINFQNLLVNNNHNSHVSLPSRKEASTRKIAILPESEQPPTNIGQIVQRSINHNRKRSIRRLCLLVCVTTVVAFVLAVIAAVVILATKSKTTSSVSPSTTTTFTTGSITSTTSSSSATTTTSTSSTSTSSSTLSTSLTATATTSETSTTSPTSSTSSTTSESTSTTSASTSTTTTYSCSASAPITLGTVTGSSSLAYTQYKYNYTATKPVPTLSFGITAPSNIYIYLDDISVVDVANSSVELPDNPSFENSTTILTGWDIWCSSLCDGGNGGTIVNGTCRAGNCYRGRCSTSNFDYLIQTFSATIGRLYTISFWYRRDRTGGFAGTSTLSVGII